MDQVEVLGAKINTLDMVETIGVLNNFINTGGFHHVVTLNAEVLYNAQGDTRALAIINNADHVTADGSGIVWAVRELHGIEIERVTGIDLMQEICAQASKFGWKIYLLGAAPDVAKKAANVISEKYLAEVVGYDDGYFSITDEALRVEKIRNSGANILFVAMGSPKQDEFILRNKQDLGVNVAIGVGGSFDVIAGNVKRAPAIFQKLGVEWLWRLVSQPSRIGRMLVLPKFTLLVKKSR